MGLVGVGMTALVEWAGTRPITRTGSVVFGVATIPFDSMTPARALSPVVSVSR